MSNGPERSRLTATELQRLLDVERIVTQKRPCKCRAPLPFWRAPPKAGCSNWQLILHACPNECHLKLREAREYLKQRYDLESPLAA